jgi:cell division protease FtsH
MNTFDRIIGYEREKKELGRICDMLINEEKYKKLGVNIPNALLIHGDPGLGKTLMAKTLAESSGRVVYSCPKTKPDGSFVDNIKETFEKASKNAPSIVFLDDMDKFAEDNKSSDSNKEEFVVIQACLEEVKDKNVFVIATANNIDNLPESLVRAGRFGRQIYVSFPTINESNQF